MNIIYYVQITLRNSYRKLSSILTLDLFSTFISIITREIKYKYVENTPLKDLTTLALTQQVRW